MTVAPALEVLDAKLFSTDACMKEKDLMAPGKLLCV